MNHTTVVKVELTTKTLHGQLFAISQYARSVSDLTDEDVIPPSPFHSVSEPPSELPEYVLGAARLLQLNKRTVLHAIAYVAIYAQRSGRAPSTLSVHRLFAAALLLASKTLQPDSIATVDDFASVLGLAGPELVYLHDALRRSGVTTRVPDAVVMDLFNGLEEARHKSLRREISAAVSGAFQVPTPRRRSIERRIELPSISIEPTPPSLAGSRSSWWLSASPNTSSIHPSPSGSSSGNGGSLIGERAKDFAAGSASSAALTLRRRLADSSCESSSTTTPVFALPSFDIQFGANVVPHRGHANPQRRLLRLPPTTVVRR